MRILTTAGAIALLLVLPSVARAQFSAPIRYNEGPGIKLGPSFVFHPGAAVEGRYDSNALYEESNPDGAGYMRFIAHLHLASLSPQRLTDGEGKKYSQKVDFRLKSAFSFRKYFSDNANVTAQDAFEVDAGLGLTLFPQGVFSFSIQDDFARTVAPPNGEANIALERDTNRAALKLKLAPGGGLLAFTVGYALNLDLFEDSKYSFANRMFHEISLNAKWKLLPKTAIFLDATEQITSYYDRNASDPISNNDSYPLRIYLGLGGLITPRLSVLVKAGYGNSFHNTVSYTALDDGSYNMVLGKAELGYQFTPFAKLKAGYDHNFQDSFFANYFVDEQVYLGYDHLIAGRFLAHARADYRYRQYDGFPQGGINGETIDALSHHLITLNLGFDWQIKEWVYVGIGYDAQVKDITKGPKNVGGVFANDYAKHQVFGKVGFSY